MAKYPIKMLKDEEGTPFVPLVSTEALRTPEGETIEEKLEKKLEPSNIIAGTDITLSVDGNNITINNASKGVLINNLTTEQSGVGSLDAHQGKVLKDMIPDIVNNLTTTSTNKALSAYQGYLLNHKVVPTGGTTGQVLKKSSNDDHALEWGDAADPNAIVGDGSIKKIIELTYEEYQVLEASGKVDDHTEYHIDEHINDPGFLEDLISKVLLSKHPIGSIEINLTGENPANYLGGEWEQIKDTFLLACGNKYNLGTTGGEATHTLKINEMPRHNHAVNYWVNSNLPGGIDHFLAYGNTSSAKPNRTQVDSWVEKEGGDQPHNNMPPYLAVSVWKRIG